MKAAAAFFSAFFRQDAEARLPAAVRWGFLTVLFLLGAAFWAAFLNFGAGPWEYHDWAEVNLPRLAFVQDAVRTGQLPLHMPDSSALRGLTDRFHALPDVILSPQLLLLGVMPLGVFILVNWLLLYAAGFAGLLALRRQEHLSLGVFTSLFLLLNFNGHLAAHLGVGHVTWGGTFLFPWLALLILRLLAGDTTWRWAAQTAALLFLIFLQGSFHQYVWALMFLGILGLAAWAWQQICARRLSPLWAPLGVLALLSVGSLYQPFAGLPIPLLNAERVSSRMLILPVTMACILGGAAWQRLLDGRQRAGWGALLLGVNALLGADLLRQAYAWRVTAAAAVFPFTPVDVTIKTVANHADPPYTGLLLAGLAVTTAAALALAFFVRREARPKAPNN
ncbi:hypothetical protein [Levilinea saccharolytica]|uniref:Uncharacterized protein n=1 Tax=Levilinea saccharolytica TaxID=229921 RepID=A0A0M9U322_9CHLR|nr:hypothetical protein [Levilinea saccharolytica]GAP19336.1 hypothetical protein LSAC_03238 [Levilinea saccharolytica]